VAASAVFYRFWPGAVALCVRPCLKRIFKTLLGPIPEAYVALFCGIGGVLLWMGAIMAAVTRQGGAALLFLLLGSAGIYRLGSRKAP
jgi:hypothetical protein